MGCPHLKEVVMVYCDALPMKKPVPADRVVQTGRCLCEGFQDCPIYREAVARLRMASEQEILGPARAAGGRKERS